jgi:hypothetical protein
MNKARPPTTGWQRPIRVEELQPSYISPTTTDGVVTSFGVCGSTVSK